MKPLVNSVRSRWIRRVSLAASIAAAGSWWIHTRPSPSEPPVAPAKSNVLGPGLDEKTAVSAQPASSIPTSDVRSQPGQTPATVPLTDAERSEFFREISTVFNELAPASLDKETLKQKLMRLNERGTAGLQAIVATLSKAPEADHEVAPRLPMIDYLIYRARFDPESLAQLERLASQPIDPQIRQRYRAPMLADKAEMLGGLAAVNWDKAAVIIVQTKDSLQKSLMANEAYHALVGNGASEDYSKRLIREVVPEFKI